jgi:hypothetical protein
MQGQGQEGSRPQTLDVDLIEAERDARYGTIDAGKTPTEEDMKVKAVEKHAALAVLVDTLDRLSPQEDVNTGYHGDEG